MKRKRSGGKSLLPQPMWPCRTCGKAGKPRIGILGDNVSPKWTHWSCFMKDLKGLMSSAAATGDTK